MPYVVGQLVKLNLEVLKENLYETYEQLCYDKELGIIFRVTRTNIGNDRSYYDIYPCRPAKTGHLSSLYEEELIPYTPNNVQQQDLWE